MFSQRPLFDMPDKEIKDLARAMSPHLVQSFSDLMRELDRRAAERNARALRTMTAVLAGSTVVYTVATLLLVAVTWAKP